MSALLFRHVLVVLSLYAGGARAADDAELASVLSSDDWLIAPGSLTFRAPVDGLYPPWIATWERIDVEDKSLYIKVLVNCDDFTVVPFLTVAPDRGIVPIVGAKPQAMEVEPGSPQDRMARAVCANYGYFS